MDQSGAPASRVFIVWYKHGREPIRLHELSEVFKNYRANGIQMRAEIYTFNLKITLANVIMHIIML